MRIVVKRKKLMKGLFRSIDGWMAYREDYPHTWEAGDTPQEAIGRLIITYARAWPERWPGLTVDGLE